jgi:hypothetical protein
MTRNSLNTPETVNPLALTDRGLVQRQMEVIAQQDAMLGQIEQGVGRLHNQVTLSWMKLKRSFTFCSRFAGIRNWFRSESTPQDSQRIGSSRGCGDGWIAPRDEARRADPQDVECVLHVYLYSDRGHHPADSHHPRLRESIILKQSQQFAYDKI